MTMRDIYVYCTFFLNVPNAHIIAGSQLRQIYSHAVGIGNPWWVSQPARAIPSSDAIAPRESHMLALLHFLRYSVERESRSTCANQIAKLSSIGGFIIGKVYGVCTRARMRDREQSAWKVTREIAMTISLSLSLSLSCVRGEIPTQRKWLTRFLVHCVVTPILFVSTM